ncbi:MAG: flagellar FliJ family protein [Deltaproteobacteria bacterium]|nr:flagellar FliJ family protein [Deltaproteobacteria bacterium]
MALRSEKVSKIARIIDHQKEVIEFQVQEITNRMTLERGRLNHMEEELQNTIDRFEERLNDRVVLNSEEVNFLFGMASTFFTRLERKKREIAKIEKELEAQQAVFWEAYKKKKAIDIFQNKIVFRERREEAILEQKNMDYLNLSSRLRK